MKTYKEYLQINEAPNKTINKGVKVVETVDYTTKLKRYKTQIGVISILKQNIVDGSVLSAYSPDMINYTTPGDMGVYNPGRYEILARLVNKKLKLADGNETNALNFRIVKIDLLKGTISLPKTENIKDFSGWKSPIKFQEFIVREDFFNTRRIKAMGFF